MVSQVAEEKQEFPSEVPMVETEEMEELSFLEPIKMKIPY
jgi:hypothetical protein